MRTITLAFGAARIWQKRAMADSQELSVWLALGVAAFFRGTLEIANAWQAAKQSNHRHSSEDSDRVGQRPQANR